MSKASIASRFKPKNTVWKVRKSHGRKPLFANPDMLELACYNYFQWAEDNPIYRVETVKYQGVCKPLSVPVMRPFTLHGLCQFLVVSMSTWANYRKKPDFLGVTERVENIIYVQKLDGAAAGIFNAKIVMRDIQIRAQRERRHV